MTKNVNSTSNLSTIIKAKAEVFAAERVLEKAMHRDARTEQQAAEKATAVSEAKKALRAASKAYGERARQVRVCSLDGELLRIENDGCRALQEAGVNEVAYERQAEAAAAAMYENGVLDI